jgi:putative peptide maturation system protein
MTGALVERTVPAPVVPAVALPVIAEAVELLIRLRAHQVPEDAAWDEVVRLRERHPGRFVNLVWERESYVDKIHYDLLVEVAGGTLSISYCADEDLPWPARGLQRVTESLVLRVNDDPVQIGQAVTSLDYAWHQLHVGRHLIDMSLIDQEIRTRRIEVSDAQLADALTAFRVQRRLFTAAALAQWMAEHGASLVQLENHLRHDVARGELRRQVTGGPGADGVHDAYFAAHRADFERVQLARMFVAEREPAEALLRELRAAPHRFLQVAQQRFLEGAAPGELFTTLWRDELEAGPAAQLFDVEPGELAPVVASGDGFELIQVLRRLPAALDDETRRRIGDRLFDRWLDDQRACARVEWFWGAAEATEVPAIAL